jgi:hypothetical protein
VLLAAVYKGKDCDNLFALLSVFIAFLLDKNCSLQQYFQSQIIPVNINAAHKNHHNYHTIQQ